MCLTIYFFTDVKNLKKPLDSPFFYQLAIFVLVIEKTVLVVIHVIVPNILFVKKA